MSATERGEGMGDLASKKGNKLTQEFHKREIAIGPLSKSTKEKAALRRVHTLVVR